MSRALFVWPSLSILHLALACQATPPASGPSAEPAPDVPEGPQRAALSVAECEAKGGEIHGDPGDGRLQRDGCPDGLQTYGAVQLGIEGSLCCERRAASDAPASSGKRAPCTTDASCNASPEVSALWGRCVTDTGVCECKEGYELNPGGFCQPKG